MNQLSVAKQKTIIVLATRGWLQRRIARELGIHRETVARYLNLAIEREQKASKPAKVITGSGESKPAKVITFAVGGHCIMGEPKKESIYAQLYNFLINDLFPKLKNKGVNEFEFSVGSIETQMHILKLFSDKTIGSEDEYFYKMPDKTEVKMRIPLEYSIAKVNAKFVKRLELGKYKNKELLEERLLESWGSYRNFLNKSLAFVALHQERIRAVIVGTARFNNVIPVDIETDEQHRKKGLASILTQYFVNECLDSQLAAQWCCVDSNDASKKTAQKNGFSFLKKKPYYWFDI